MTKMVLEGPDDAWIRQKSIKTGYKHTGISIANLHLNSGLHGHPRRFSSCTMFRSSLFFVAILIQTVFGYESVYDMIERKNQRRTSSRNRYLEPRVFGHDPYLTFDSKPGIFGYDRPTAYEKIGFRYFGNGYDNLGNGHVPDRDGLYYLRHGSLRPEYRPHFRERFDSGYDYPRFYYVHPRRDFVRYDRGDSGILKTDSFASSQEGNNQRQGVESFGNRRASFTNDSNKRENYGEKAFTDRNGENKSSLRSNRFSKKGHVTKGFSNHHHKDETGNSTTFYDEYSDHGGQTDFKDVADGFGTKTTLDHVHSGENAKFFHENEGKMGNYGSGSVKDDEKGERDLVLRENAFEKGENIHFEGESARGRKNFIRDRGNFDFPSYTSY